MRGLDDGIDRRGSHPQKKDSDERSRVALSGDVYKVAKSGAPIHPPIGSYARVGRVTTREGFLNRLLATLVVAGRSAMRPVMNGRSRTV